jgi:hypothetical protein
MDQSLEAIHLSHYWPKPFICDLVPLIMREGWLFRLEEIRDAVCKEEEGSISSP